MVQFASRMDLLHGSEIRELLKLTAQPDIISFAGGLPAARAYGGVGRRLATRPARGALPLRVLPL